MNIHYKIHLIKRTTAGFQALRESYRDMGTFKTFAEAKKACDA